MPKQKPGRSKQDYETPPEFIDAVKRKFRITEFSADFAASKDNAQATTYYTAEDNSFVQDWLIAGYNWLNPTFDRLDLWTKKAAETYDLCYTGVEPCELWHLLLLMPASTGSNYWRDNVDGIAAVYLLNGRLTFMGQTAPYPKDCVLLHYGINVNPEYRVWNWRE